MPHFVGEVGQRYKIHYKKGRNFENMEGKDPNRYDFSGVYAGIMQGLPYLAHRFTDVTYMDGSEAMEMMLMDNLFDSTYTPVKQGGRRRHTRRHRRRASTRRH
jgi:hypothetical protein